jgi:RHS repeat-associated protein
MLATAIPNDATTSRNPRPTTTYDDGYGKFLYPYQVKRRVTASPLFELISTSLTDYKWGKPTSVTDPSNAVTSYSSSLYAQAGDPPVQVVAAGAGRPVLVLLLRRDAQIGLALCVIVVGTGLLLAPWRRKRVVGVAVRHGHVIGVVIVFGLSALPWPLMLRPLGPAAAEAQSVPWLVHFHVDHLGSTQVVTKSDGTVFEQVRYRAYGEVRGHYTDAGGSLTDCADDRYCHEFTQYDTEPMSQLEYAGARYYDPQFGVFLTHDPARQFASPYAYGPWDPVNGTDPNGAVFGIDDLIIAFAVGFAIGFTVTAIQAGINGASLGAALKAGLISGAISGGLGAGLGLVGAGIAALNSPAISLAYNLVLTGASTYGAVESFRSGNYVLGAAAVVGVAFGAAGAYKSGRAVLRTTAATESAPPTATIRATDGLTEEALPQPIQQGQVTEQVLPNEIQVGPPKVPGPIPRGGEFDITTTFENGRYMEGPAGVDIHAVRVFGNRAPLAGRLLRMDR